jgi:hypothetical protein
MRLSRRRSFVRTATVVASREDRDDGEDIFGHLLIWVVGVLRVENHDFGTMSFRDPLDELETETGQVVTIGNGNNFDSSEHNLKRETNRSNTKTKQKKQNKTEKRFIS